MARWKRSLGIVAVLLAAVIVLAGPGLLIAKRLKHGYAQWRLPAEVAANADHLFHGRLTPVMGNPDARVNVVVFTDYNCPYCREGEPSINRLEEHARNIRLVLKELPILGDDSVAVAKLALAAKKQGRYWPFRVKLFEADGHMTAGRALVIARGLGIDTEKLRRDAASPEIEDELDENRILANQIGVPGVPYYLVGDQQIDEGPHLYQRLEEAISAARARSTPGGVETCEASDCEVHAGF